MELSIKQTIALDLLEDKSTNEILFGGGAGGGKTALGCYWQLKQRLKYPNTRGLIGRAVLKTLKETTLVSFFQVAKMQGEIKGLENAMPIRMVYIDTREEVIFKSAAAASRKTKVSAQVIRESLNPIARKKFIVDGRVVAFRVVKS